MFYRFILAAFFLLFFGVSFFPALARPSRRVKFKHADKNKDGVIDKKEIHMEKKWENKQRIKHKKKWKAKADKNKDGVVDKKERVIIWKQRHFKVNNPLEKKYDLNSDGWLSSSETKELKDKRAIIKTNGKAKVDTNIEEYYDSDGDGVISAKEAKQLNQDLN
ncbi:MAG: hypothetical protein K9L84_04525 [Candidatus Omnitrophica bacterium]|nr:hypothetical protein [Candidatus Omnitrophota bacterium]MCF7894307.1 hypothetical protein [Candidatus Omnitrophota bacterium]